MLIEPIIEILAHISFGLLPRLLLLRVIKIEVEYLRDKLRGRVSSVLTKNYVNGTLVCTYLYYSAAMVFIIIN
jgi:hypothetical protein